MIFRLSKSVVINAPSETVYDYVRFLKTKKIFCLGDGDPNVKMTYTGTDGTVGAISAWVSDDKNVGVGEQEIKALVPNEKMTVEIRFKKPIEGVKLCRYNSRIIWRKIRQKVTNTFYGSNPYPFNIMCQFMDMFRRWRYAEKYGESPKKNLEQWSSGNYCRWPTIEIKQKLVEHGKYLHWCKSAN